MWVEAPLLVLAVAFVSSVRLRCATPSSNAQAVTIDVLAVVFITSRLLYIICYLADWAALRSLAWAIGMGIIAALFIVSA